MSKWRVLGVLPLLLAGCSGDDKTEAPQETEEPPCAEGFCVQDPLVTEDGRDLRTDLLATDRIQAPVWNVGDVFEQHMFFGRDDRAGQHVQTMVVAAGNDGYTIATSDEAAARFESVYDYPFLGHIGKGLEISAFQSDWSGMYSFPLTDGTQWSGSIDDLINWNSYYYLPDFDLQMTASYADAIDTPHGDFPGFWIEAYTQDDDLLARYNYVPAVGWFSHLWLFDVETENPDDIMFHAMSMGTSKNYTGPYYTATSETVFEDLFGVFPPLVEGDPTPKTFDFPDDQSAMMGIILPMAAPGSMDVRVTDPDGFTESHSYSQFNMDGRGFDVFLFEADPLPGEWQVQDLGAGVYFGAYVWLNAVAVTSTELA
jgi:hypothetical protein